MTTITPHLTPEQIEHMRLADVVTIMAKVRV